LSDGGYIGTGMMVQIPMYNKKHVESKNRIKKNNKSKLKYRILDHLSISIAMAI
jgi:hypothetical protein